MQQSTQSRLGCGQVIGKLLDRRYRIVGYLGSGSFAKTYLAVDTRRPGQPKCAIKHICPVTNTTKSLFAARRRFQREAQTLEKLGKHDQIPQLLAYFQSKQEFCLVEEYIPGKPLMNELLPGQPLSEDIVIDLLQQVLEILVFVHSHQVIHRDVSPTNIIRREIDGKLVLIDFGTVKEISAEYQEGQSPRTIATGTPAYMPIEQFRGHPQFNSDIYALGTIAIQAITGVSAKELPKFKITRSPKTSEKVWRERSQLNPDIADLIDKMVCDDCTVRYQSAAEVLKDLQKIIGRSKVSELPQTIIDLPVNIRQYSGWYSGEQVDSLLRWVILALVAIVVGGGLIWGFQSRTHIKAKELYNRGMEKAVRGDRTGAIEDYTQAIALLPNDGDAYNSRGKVRFEMGEYQAAIEDYTRTIETNPYHASAYDNRCSAQLSLKKFEDALSDCTRAIKLNANYATAYHNRCIIYYNLGAYQRAIEDCTGAIQLNASDPEAYNNRGLARSANGESIGAIEDFTRAIQLNSSESFGLMPTTADAYANRCSAKLNMKNLEGAIADCTSAIRLNPNYAAAYNTRCVIHLKRRARMTAIDDCTRAIEINPNDASIYSNRGLARYEAVGERLLAIADFTRAIQLNPKNADVYRYRGIAYHENADYEGAIADFIRAIQLNPQDADAYTHRGSAYYKLARYGSAIADFTRAIGLLPQSEAAYFGRGQARAGLGDKLRSIEDFQKAAQLCIDKGMTACYNDSRLEIKKLQQ